MPICAAPCATKVATSKARTRMIERPVDIGRELERAAALLEELRLGLDARALQQRQRLVEDASLGNGKDDRPAHDRRALGLCAKKGNARSPAFRAGHIFVAGTNGAPSRMSI